MGGGALFIGSIAGAWCTFGYVYITPFLERTIGLYDTCGKSNQFIILYGHVHSLLFPLQVCTTYMGCPA